MRLAREAGPDRPRGFAGKLANWRAPSPMPPMSMASEFGPFPVYVPDLKDFRVNWALSLVLGPLGVDRFHRGHYVTGVLKLLTFGGAGIWWATDQLAVASGRAVTRGDHPMTGRRSHRILAGAVSAAVIAGAAATTVITLAPRTDEAKDLLIETVAPEPPQPTWEPLASLSGPKGTATSEPFSVTGDGVAFDYVLQDAGFIYLLPADAAAVTEDMVPMVSTLIADTGTITQVLAPGDYILVVKSPVKPWDVQISQRMLR